jgi:hypothetical protein
VKKKKGLFFTLMLVRDHWEDLDVGGSIILSSILEKQCGVAQDRDQLKALVNMIMNLGVQ